MPKQIRVIYFPVGGEPEIRMIEDDLKTMQDLVGGYFESFPLDSIEGPEVDLIINEEGKLTGPFFATSKPDSKGEATSLNIPEVEAVIAYFKGKEL